MKKYFLLVLVCVLAVSLMAQPRGWGQDGNPRLMARRAAILDGQRAMGELLHGVKIDSQSTVKDFVLVNDQINANMETLVQGVRVVDTRYRPDGTCEVDVELDLMELVLFLKMQQVQYPHPRFRNTNFDQILRTHPSRVLRATGMGTIGAPVPGPEDGEKAQLRQQVQDLQQQLAQLQNLQQQLAQLQQQNQQVSAENARLAQENAQLKQKVDSMGSYYTKWQQETASLRQSLEAAQAANTRLTNENVQLKQQISQLASLQNIQQQYNAVVAENIQLKNKYNMVVAQNAQLQQQQQNYTALESRYNTLLASSRLMEPRLQQATQEAAVAKQQLAAAQQQLTATQQQLVATQQELQKMQQEHQGCQETLNKYTQLQQEFQQLQQKSSAQESMIEELRARSRRVRYEDYEKMKNDLEVANKKLATFDAIYVSYQNLQNEKQALQDNLNAANNKIAELDAAYQNSQNELAAVNKKTGDQERIKQQMQILQAQAQFFRNQSAEKDQEIARLQKKLEDLGTNVLQRTTPQQKAAARRAAYLDGCRQLLENVKGIQINSTDRVENFVLQSSEINAAVEGYLNGAKIVATRYLPDLTCEVDVEIDTRDFVARLQILANQYPSRINTQDLNGILINYQNPVIKATGVSAIK